MQGQPSADRRPLVWWWSAREHAVLIALSLGLLGVWLLAHPYHGLVHDGIFYAGQALLTANPGTFDQDLFFRYGSQNDFTFFTPLYAALVARAGLETASMLAVAVAHALWVSGAVHLVCRVSERRMEAAAALVVVASGVAVYAGMAVLHYGEGFATARPFAEGLVLHGLAWLIAGRRITAALAALAAALLHPLMALPGLVVGTLYLAFQDQRWLALAFAASIAVLVCAFFGISPADRLLQTMDGVWFSLVKQRNANAFPAQWWASDWGWFLIHVAGVAGAALATAGKSRIFFLAVLAAGLGGLLLAFVGGDWLQNVLVIQLQTWRARWLLAVAGNAGIGILLFRLWQQQANAVLLSWLLCAAALWAIFIPGRAPLAVLLVLTAAQIKWAFRPAPELARSAAIVTGAASFLSFLAIRAYQLPTDVGRHLSGSNPLGYNPVDFVLLGAVIALLAHARWFRQSWRALLTGALVFVLGASLWDRRDTQQQALEARVGKPNPFVEHLRPRDEVYWRRGLGEVWFLLGRPSYVTTDQGAGIMFSRETALEYARRAKSVAPLDNRDFLTKWYPSSEVAEEGLKLSHPTVRDLVRVCTSARGPDAVVLEHALGESWVAEWRLPISHAYARDETPPPEAYYLYLCRHVAAG